MKASDIAKIIEEIAPSSLAYEGEETGFIVGNGEKEVKVLAVTERPTREVLQEAVGSGVDMLIIHEPLYQSKKNFLVSELELKYLPNKQREWLVKQGDFCIFRLHSQWDDAVGGNNDTLAKLLEIKVDDKIPYGRIGNVAPQKLKEFAKLVIKNLGADGVLMVGDEEKEISRVAVVAGSGNSLTEIIEIAKNKGSEVLVSGDIQDSRARFANEIGLAVIDAGDYFTENPGAKQLAIILQQKLLMIKVLHLDPGSAWRIVK